MITCPICHQQTPGVNVHGHVQCHICKNNIQPCCQGETCEPLTIYNETVLPTPDA
jgi:hypothetical protein